MSNYIKFIKMHTSQKNILKKCDTLMLDMDGTILDLAYDSFIWLDLVPKEYAKKLGISLDDATAKLYKYFISLQGTLKWYSVDHWSDLLDIDIIKLHQMERAKIQYLPGAEKFLNDIKKYDIRVLLVTNAHGDILKLKSEVTGMDKYFDQMYVSHDFGAPKESQLFWQNLNDTEKFDIKRTLFVDDTEKVLDSARQYGIDSLVQITNSDSKQKQQIVKNYLGMTGVIELIE